MPCCAWKCVPTDVSGGVDISEMSFVTTDDFLVRVTKINLTIVASLIHSIPF